jgi:GNAT superfamily N-acetyltransferase
MYLLLIPYSFFNMLRDLIILCTVITCTAVVQITRIDKSILNFNLPVLQKAAVLCSVTFPELESSTLDWTEDIKSRLQYESVLFVALEHGEAVGVAEISLRAGTSSWSLIENVCVHPECRKLGIGALLVKTKILRLNILYIVSYFL